MKPPQNYLLAILLISVTAITSLAQQLNWTVIATASERISTIYFLDKNIGFYAIGTVPGDPSVTAKLFRTSDGGNSWNQATVESLGGNGISDIQFDDQLNGFACGGSTDTKGRFWITSDGGITWKKRNGTGLSYPMTTRKTAAGILVTDFFNQLLISTDNGNNFTVIETTPIPETHLGIDFVDSLHGVVDGNYRQSSTAWYYTEDGGLSWQSSGTQMETWSIYGERGTSNFYACPEGYSNGSGYKSQVFRSKNYGKSFQEVFRFPFQMTGHMTGAGGALYTQTAFITSTTEKGFYRSTDQGENWKSLGGPTGQSDTRFFVVPDCGGNIIYASGLDRKVYKAVDNIGSVGGGGTKEMLCTAVLNTSAPVTPGTKVTVPIDIQVGNEPDFIGAIPEEVEYVIEFSTSAIDTAKFNKALDVVPPVGWAIKSAAMQGDSLKVVLLNVANDAMTSSQGFGFVVLTALTGSPQEYSSVILRSISFASSCSRILIEPTIEQSTLTRITISTSSVALIDQDDHLSLYPNPASNNISVRSQLLTTGKSSITIFDVRGVVVMDIILPLEGSGEHQLSLEMLPKGSYILRLTHSSHAPILKAFIIE